MWAAMIFAVMSVLMPQDDQHAKQVAALRHRTLDQAWGLRMYENWKTANDDLVFTKRLLETSERENNKLRNELAVIKRQIAEREARAKLATQPSSAPAGNRYEDPLDLTGSRQIGVPSTGDVKVRGYYRKDGTYVKPHTRSRPRR